MGKSIKELIEAYVEEREAERLAAAEQRRADAEAAIEVLEKTIAASEIREVLELGPVKYNTEIGNGVVEALGTITLGGMDVQTRVAAVPNNTEFSVGFTVVDSWPHSVRHYRPTPKSLLENFYRQVAEQALEVMQQIEQSRMTFAADEARKAREKAEREVREARGRRGAALLQRWATEYVALATTEEQSLEAWAVAETARLWQPWSGWRVRYAPVGLRTEDESAQEYFVQAVYILDDLAAVIAQSPGAVVRAIDPYTGTVEDKVIGAFLDAEPFEYSNPCTDSSLPLHAVKTVWGLKRAYVVNCPPGAPERPVAPPQTTAWSEFLAGKGVQDTHWLGGMNQKHIADDLRYEEMIDFPAVQALAELEDA